MSEESPTYAKPPMPAAWCAARRAEIQAYVDGADRRNHGETRTYLIELLAQLAAAEARATEAAAEAGKWKAEARAHAARCAVLEKADAAPYCEGQCGICDCETAPVAPQVGFGPEDGWIADLLSGTIPVEGQPAAPAPVAPQQQEGGGQVPGMPEAQCHGCGLPSHVARCQTAGCPMKAVAA